MPTSRPPDEVTIPLKETRMLKKLLTAAVLSFATAACAQTFKPEVGQAGKDVVWVPTPDALVERMLNMAKVTKNDFVIDLGSGDGRIAIAAGKRGARAMGIEYNPNMVELSNRNAQAAGVSDRVKFVKADIFESDFSQAQVITMYLLPHLNVQLRPKILDMKPGTRVTSHAFTMEDWKPDETATIEYRDAYLWIVPAKVNGKWRVSQVAGSGMETIELDLAQKYQFFDGKAKLGGRDVDVLEGRLAGERITFTLVDGNGARRNYTGTVSGDRIEGTVPSQSGAPLKWTAVKG
jgi:phospholipid N-methyltransferase